MITCTKDNEGTFTITGLTSEHLEVIQEGILRLFAESKTEADRLFRRQVRMINRPIDNELDKIFNNQVFQRNIHFGSEGGPAPAGQT